MAGAVYTSLTVTRNAEAVLFRSDLESSSRPAICVQLVAEFSAREAAVKYVSPPLPSSQGSSEKVSFDSDEIEVEEEDSRASMKRTASITSSHRPSAKRYPHVLELTFYGVTYTIIGFYLLWVCACFYHNIFYRTSIRILKATLRKQKS